jgi:CheY-like chemotaxis protein
MKRALLVASHFWRTAHSALASLTRRVLIKPRYVVMNERKPDSREHSQRDGPLIYVVDDEPMLLELASVILEPLGYAVETFRSPESALLAFETSEPPPALLITDFAMHSMTGLQLAAACRQIRPHQKILLLSGTVGSEVLHNAPIKPDSFLAKPYQAKQLSDMVTSMLAS